MARKTFEQRQHDLRKRNQFEFPESVETFQVIQPDQVIRYSGQGVAMKERKGESIDAHGYTLRDRIRPILGHRLWEDI